MKPTKFKIPYDINLKSQEFVDVVNTIIKDYQIEEIVETGCFNGLGSTLVFAKTGKSVFSIECNPFNVSNASENLRNYDNVCIIHGLSIKRDDLILGIMNEEYSDEVIMDSRFPKVFYVKEIMQNVVAENVLMTLTQNFSRQLVFLDSAGGAGHIEYKNFMNLNDVFKHNKVLLLDDVNHVKHKRSLENLKELYKVVNVSSDQRFAWVDLSKDNLK